MRACIARATARGLLGVAVCWLAGCAGVSTGVPPSISDSPWAAHPVVPPAGPDAAVADLWQHYPLPGKRPSQYTYARHEGRDAVAVRSESSASMLRRQVRVEPSQLDIVRFSWKVPELMHQADLANRDAADSPVRIVLAFEGDRSRFSARNAMLSELARSLTGEELPYATLMYVWCNQRAPGTVITSPRTDRIRKLVVESGAQRLNRWVDYERNIRADYERAFGEPPGALVGIGIMTDSDNTGAATRAWYGPLTLGAATAR